MFITMTAVLRPEVLENTLLSFEKKLFKNFKDHNLIVNIDPVGEGTPEDVLSVIYGFFKKENVKYNISELPHFGKAAKWCFSQVTKEMKKVFHLEDDWKLLYDVDLNDLVYIIDNNPRIASVRLLPVKLGYSNNPRVYKKDKKFFIVGNTMSLNPCLCEADFLEKYAIMMKEKYNPELQAVRSKINPKLKRYTQKFTFVVYSHEKNPIVENIGNEWKIKMGLKRGVSDFVKWRPRKNGRI